MCIHGCMQYNECAHKLQRIPCEPKSQFDIDSQSNLIIQSAECTATNHMH